MNAILEKVSIAALIDYGLNVIGALVLVFAAWVVSGWARRATARALERTRMDATLVKFFANFAKYTVMVLAILACLGIFGVETVSFAAVFAAVGFAIGLAFQGTLSNFAAGVMVLTFRPFKVGDVVNVGGVTGKVEQIDLFTTTLDTPDNRRIIMPNAAVAGTTIENFTHHDTRRVDVNVGTDYSADLDATRRVLQMVADAEPAKLPDRDSQVYLLELGDSSIAWVVRVWTKTENYWAVRERLTRDIKVGLDKAGISIPFPQMDVHMDGALKTAS